MPEGKKSYAVNFILQDEQKTLNDKQIDAIMQKIIENLKKQLNAELRWFDHLTIYYLTIDMTEIELKERFKNFSIRIVKMVDSLPNTISGRAIGAQIVRSGTSPAANYRAACLAKSEKDFLNKLKMVEEELDETEHWMEVIAETEMIPQSRIELLRKECVELLKIIVSSIVSTRKHLNKTI